MAKDYSNSEEAAVTLPPMTYLYEEKDLSEATSIISLIAQAIALKNFSTIDSGNTEQLEVLEDFESISHSIELLARATVISNPNFNEKDFQRLCDESIKCYRSNYIRRMGSFWKGLHNWQKLFEGCPMFSQCS